MYSKGPSPIRLLLLCSEVGEAEEIGSQLNAGKIRNPYRAIVGRDSVEDYCSSVAAGHDEEQSPGLVLLDSVLSDLLPQLRGNPDLAVAEILIIEEAFSAEVSGPEGAQRVLTKPFTADKLLAALSGIPGVAVTVVTSAPKFLNFEGIVAGDALQPRR